MKKMIIGVAVAATALVGLAPSALAKSVDVRAVGSCTAASTAKLKAGPRDGGVRIEFEVDENVVGTNWHVTIVDNGQKVLGRNYVTVAPSGSFSARKLVRDQPGTDAIVAKATNTSTGEVCRARVAV